MLYRLFIRFPLYFFLSFALLSFPVGDKVLFQRIYSFYIKEIKKPSTQWFTATSKKIWKKSKEVGKQIYTGALPPEDNAHEEHSASEEAEIVKMVEQERY